MGKRIKYISYFSHFFVKDKVFNKKTELEGKIIEMFPLDRVKVLWSDGTNEWFPITTEGDINGIAKIIHWEE